MEDKNRYLRYIPIAPDIYEGLQEIWSYDLLNYFEHSSSEAVTVARRLGAVQYFSDNVIRAFRRGLKPL